MITLMERWNKQPRYRELMSHEWTRLDLGERQDILQYASVAGDASRLSLHDVIARCKGTSRAEYVLDSINRPKITLLSPLPKTSHLNWAKADMEWAEMRGDDELFDKSMEEYETVAKMKPKKTILKKTVDIPLPESLKETDFSNDGLRASELPMAEEPGIDSQIQKALREYMNDKEIEKITSGEFIRDVESGMDIGKPPKPMAEPALEGLQ